MEKLHRRELQHPGRTRCILEKYCAEEKVLYQKILGEKITTISGKVADLVNESKWFRLNIWVFLDGISESLMAPIDLETIELDSEIKLEIDFAKLYKNMLAVPAEWLYNLEEWNNFSQRTNGLSWKKNTSDQKPSSMKSRWAETIPAHVAPVKNIKSAAVFSTQKKSRSSF